MQGYLEIYFVFIMPSHIKKYGKPQLTQIMHTILCQSINCKHMQFPLVELDGALDCLKSSELKATQNPHVLLCVAFIQCNVISNRFHG